MTVNRDKKRDIKITNEHIQKKDEIVPKEKSWLDHTDAAGTIDYELLQGATLDQISEKCGQSINRVNNHISHLKKEHGLSISNNDGIYKLENESQPKNVFNKILFDELFSDYVSYCKRSQWLKYREAYKFRFGRWLSSRVDFDQMDDDAVLKICRDSQEEYYDEGIKGVNFIKSSLQYQDDFISLHDIKILRKLNDGGKLKDNDLKESPLSFPKFSCWSGLLIPSKYKIYANEELTIGIAYLFNLEKYPKSGLKAFTLANDSLNIIAKEIKKNYTPKVEELLAFVFPADNTLTPSDLSWICQDFILFLNRRVLDKKVNYYWVNQGNRYKQELEYSCIVAPNDNTHHHKRLKELLEGDILIHYANSTIIATSEVSKEFEIKPRPYEQNHINELVVEVNYELLDEPITINDIKNIFETRREILPKNYSPLNINLGVNQSYCLEFNKASYNAIFNKTDRAYWIFQGNPKIYDVELALKNNAVFTWNVKAHKEKIKVGDKVIIWVTGNKSGCYALAEVTSDIFFGLDEDIERKYYAKDILKYYSNDDVNAKEDRVKIKITHNLNDSPILSDQLATLDEFQNFKGGNQGTNFSATDGEYNYLLNLVESQKSQRRYWIYAPGKNANRWDEFFENEIMAIGWDKLGDLTKYQSQQEIENVLIKSTDNKKRKYNDARACYEFCNVVDRGDIVIVKKGRTQYLGWGIVTSDYIFDNEREDFKHVRNVNWKDKGIWNEKVGEKIVLKTLTDITGYSDYVKNLRNLIGIETNKLKTTKEKYMNPVNQILYGPPGTGKTYTLKKDYFHKYTSKESSITKEMYFESVVKECSWWQVIAIALLELKKAKVSAIFDHAWVKEKARISDSKTIRPTLWGQLQSHTIPDCEFVNVKTRQTPYIFNKTRDSYWEIIEAEVKEQVPELYDLIESVNNFKPTADNEIKRYKFTTFHQSFSYEDFIEGIKPIIPQEGEEPSDLNYIIQSGVFKQLCTDAQNDPDNQYAIFIDEINRGNVSNIFGELITLIEPDKRQGAPNEIPAILPYSKKRFTVPRNVDIYGTMNTADRSVEALDTALRRRFSFIEMMPDIKVIEHEKVGDIKLSNVLQTMNDRIELLVDRDHTIGHSYFINVNSKKALVEAFKSRIIPLLQEYFYGDYGKIGLVLGKGFIEKKNNSDKEFASFDYEGQNDFITPTFTLKRIDETSIIEAVKLLLNEKEEEEIS